ncbi:thiolase family protein [Sphingomonas sp.]|uniref:thiolase family protein n=1 Tax=Sphingomonas sp. TaxID=28214 RepID=UPI003AFF7C11
MSAREADVAIIGVGESDLGVVPGRSSHALYAQAINAAIADAGLDKRAIDGLITLDSYTSKRTRHAINVAQYVGLASDRVGWISTSMHGSIASSGVILLEAAMAIRAGVCDYVVVSGADNLYSWGRSAGITKLAENRDPEFETPFGPLIVACYALVAQRYMRDYGATEESFAEVAVAARSWANLHPSAHMHGTPLDIAGVLASPMVATPFRRLMSPLISDGGCALVLTSAERAREHGDRAVTLLASERLYGNGTGIVPDDMGQLPSPYTLREGATIVARRALERAGIGLGDIDIFFQYDSFPIVTMLFLEAIGLCGEGEAHELVRGGRLAPGGDIPWTTHGGLHSYCHPGVNGGMFHLIEMVRQLRGEAGARQVKEAEIAVMQGYGANMGAFNATVMKRGLA